MKRFEVCNTNDGYNNNKDIEDNYSSCGTKTNSCKTIEVLNTQSYLSENFAQYQQPEIEIYFATAAIHLVSDSAVRLPFSGLCLS